MELRVDPEACRAAAGSLAADAESLSALATLVGQLSGGPLDPPALSAEVSVLVTDGRQCLVLLAGAADVLRDGVTEAAAAYTGADERARLAVRGA